ncbi:MAG: TonB family protein [Sulfurovum sp.]|nr:TonB family protein [Sulfurovum sp.]
MGTKETIIRTLKGVLLSLLLHLLLLLLFVVVFKKVELPPAPLAQERKIALNLSRFTPPSSRPAATPAPTIPSLAKPVEKKPNKVQAVKPPVKEKPLDQKKRLVAPKSQNGENNATKVTKKQVKKIQKKIVQTKAIQRTAKQTIKQTRPKRPISKASNDPLANALMGSGTSMYRTTKPNTSNQTDTMINQLYGREFDGFNQVQKEFIRDNLGAIHRITQRTLSRNGYPDVAIQTRQEGTNIVSFDLHPNGDITNLQLKRSIGYAALDENTLEVIRIAYKEYPRPAKTTKIVFYVHYHLQ